MKDIEEMKKKNDLDRIVCVLIENEFLIVVTSLFFHLCPFLMK